MQKERVLITGGAAGIGAATAERCRRDGYEPVIIDRVGDGIRADLSDPEATERALEQAIAQRQPRPGLIHHSDQGVHYANHRYAAILARIGAICSMSAPGAPTQNARAERFIGTLKREEVWLNEYLDVADAELQIGYFIEQIYNTERLHSKLGYLSPADFETITELEQFVEPLSA